MLGTLAARAALAAQAFALGQRAGRDWAGGRSLRDEIRLAVERESKPALAGAALTLAGVGLAALKRKEVLLLGAAGFLIGSGIWARARARALV